MKPLQHHLICLQIRTTVASFYVYIVYLFLMLGQSIKRKIDTYTHFAHNFLNPYRAMCNYSMGTTGTTWGGDHGDHSHGDHMGTTWQLWEWCGDDGDDMGTTWMTWGPRRPRGDNEITKNAITFEQIKIIEFCLKIWDPWALPHTYTYLMYIGGCPIPNDSFIQKLLLWPTEKFFSCFCTGSH